MTTGKVVRVDTQQTEAIAVITQDDSVWLTNPTWLRWASTPEDLRAHIILKCSDGSSIRVRAVKIARRHIRIGSVEK
jgi:hypothetical protein